MTDHCYGIKEKKWRFILYRSDIISLTAFKYSLTFLKFHMYKRNGNHDQKNRMKLHNRINLYPFKLFSYPALKYYATCLQ